MENFGNRSLILSRFINRKIDGLIVYRKERWIAYACVVVSFFFRMIWKFGYFAIAYFLGFYTLQNIILYMTPSGIPSITDVGFPSGLLSC